MQIAQEHPPVETLAPDAAAELMEFARACRAALHAVALYPGKHPAIARTLTRITEVCDRVTRQRPFRIAVLPADLLRDGRKLARPDTAVSEIASLLHAHVVGQITIEAGIDDAAWHRFLLLVTRAPEEVREQGGIARAWTTAGGQRIEIREVDYAEVLRERPEGESASWDAILSHCLRGDSVDLDERALRTLIEIVGDMNRLTEFARQLETRAGSSGDTRSHAAALLQMLSAVVEAIGASDPERLQAAYANMAAVVGQLPAEGMLQWIAACAEQGLAPGGTSVAGEVITRLDDDGIAQFVAGSIVVSRGASSRLAEAFQTLVPDPTRRRRLLGLAEQRAAASPLGREAGFEHLWKHAETMLTSYSDKAYVSDEYAEELDRAPLRASDVEHLSEDPPERLGAWLGSVSDSSLRTLDVQLLIDLLAVESDPFQWRDLTHTVAAQIEDLVLVGDFRGAARLVEALTAGGTDRDTLAFRQTVTSAIERLLAGQIVLHAAYHLQAVSDEEFEDAKRLCRALGPLVIKPLAEALAVDERARVRQRLADMLLGFGALGRQSVEQLKQSANPSVRRIAVHLLREFGGNEALPELESLLNDTEPNVQREAIRAILTIGTDEAYDVLQRALTTASERAHAAILQHLRTAPDERLAPLLCYVLRHTDHRGRLQGVYLEVMSALGQLGGAEAIEALGEALYRGEWWAPFRNATLRAAAAQALRRTDEEAAVAVLQDASGRGPRGVRAAAKVALAAPAPGRRKRRHG